MTNIETLETVRLALVDCRAAIDRALAAMSPAWYSTHAVAKAANMTPQAILVAIKRGEIPAHRSGNVWRIASADAEAFLRSRHE